MKVLELIHTRAARRATYAALLAALVINVLVSPILFEAGLDKSWILTALFLLVLLGCLASALDQARWFGLLVLVVIVLEILAAILVRQDDSPSTVVRHALRGIVVAVTALVLLRHLLRPGSVSADKVLGAVCVFFLLGLMWAEAYVIIEHVLPGSFAYPDGLPGGTWDERRVTLSSQYFSFVTLTTLGYGDVVPIRALARSVGVLQAIVGQFYIAIIVARLVSLYILTPHVTYEVHDEDA